MIAGTRPASPTCSAALVEPGGARDRRRLAERDRMSHPGAMHRIALSSSLASLLLACTTGSGVRGQEDRSPGDFQALDVGGPFRVDVQVGPATKVTIAGDDNVVPLVRSELDGSTLHIDLPGRVVLDLPLTVSITTPALVELDASGASIVDLSGVRGDRFEVDVSGASTATLHGQATELDADVSGASRLHASELAATRVDVDASGASTAEVEASEAVDAEASGASTVRIHGSPPQVSQDTEGASRIELVD